MKTARQILIDAAARILRPYAWTQGTYAKRRDLNVAGGSLLWGTALATDASCWCGVGAIRVEAGDDWSYENGYLDAFEAYWRYVGETFHMNGYYFNDAMSHPEPVAAALIAASKRCPQ